MSKSKIIPFSWLPASWGLKGISRAIAQAEYELSGYDLEIKLAEIKSDGDTEKFRKDKLDIDLKHKLIDQYAYDMETSILNKEGIDADIAKLNVDFNHQRITQQEYDRKKADLLGEPWMAMPKISWDPVNPSKTYFELDYNDHFVGFLRDNGYSGTDDECISRWLNDICTSIIDEMGQTDQEFVTTVRKIRLPDGKTEHS